MTRDGLEAIPALAAESYTLTMTEVMSVQQAMDAGDAWEQATVGLDSLSVFYLTHIPSIFDEYLQNVVAGQVIDIEPDILWQSGVVASKKSMI